MQTLYRGDNNASRTLVVSYYPLVGNARNTGPRYQQEANATGYDILGIERVGTNSYRPSIHLRRKLSPSNFDNPKNSVCVEEAEKLREIVADYDRVIFRGQSTGSFLTLGVIRTGLISPTHLLIEDGINTRVSRRGRPRGSVRSRLDWLKYGRKERAGMRPPEHWVAPKATVHGAETALQFAVEQFHWAPLWRSTYSRNALLDVAMTHPRVPILVKLLGHTATTTPQEASSLQQQLEEAGASRANNATAAHLTSCIDEESWHGYLVFPDYGIANLHEISKMSSLV